MKDSVIVAGTVTSCNASNAPSTAAQFILTISSPLTLNVFSIAFLIYPIAVSASIILANWKNPTIIAVLILFPNPAFSAIAKPSIT